VAVDRTIDRVWGSREPGWKVCVPQDRPADEDGRGMSHVALEAADDRELVDACVAGDRAAFDVIVRRHQLQIYQLCYRFAGTHEDASDLTQDAFVRAFRGLRGFKGGSALSTWLYRIAVNVCLNRAGARGLPVAPLGAMDHPDRRIEHVDAALLRRERAAEVRAAIARLPVKQRATLILRVYHELPHEQIAGILGSSTGAVKANFFHALANLKKLLKASS
jgi:RNA polymerase sigma-70 factor (ECF subfamily)